MFYLCSYIYSLYMSVTAFAGLGDGDFYSASPAENIAMIAYLLFNVVLGAYILGETCAVLSDIVGDQTNRTVWQSSPNACSGAHPLRLHVTNFAILPSVCLPMQCPGTVTMLMVKGDERSKAFRDRITNLKDYSNLNDLPKVGEGHWEQGPEQLGHNIKSPACDCND